MIGAAHIPRWVKAIRHLGRLNEVVQCARSLEGWPGILRRYMGMGQASYPIELRTRAGMSMFLDDFYDLVTAWVVFCRKEYEVPCDSRLIVDLGANYGAFTLAAAQTASMATIVAVEPFPAVFARLEQHIDQNDLCDRVRCWPIAVACECGERKMDGATGASQSRGLLPRDFEAEPRDVPVLATTLDVVLQRALSEAKRERIDLVKMDIEGAEHELLPQLEPTTLAAVDRWQMEYHPNGPKEPLFEAFRTAGLVCQRDVVVGSNSGVAHFAREKR